MGGFCSFYDGVVVAGACARSSAFAFACRQVEADSALAACSYADAYAGVAGACAVVFFIVFLCRLQLECLLRCQLNGFSCGYFAAAYGQLACCAWGLCVFWRGRGLLFFRLPKGWPRLQVDVACSDEAGGRCRVGTAGAFAGAFAAAQADVDAAACGFDRVLDEGCGHVVAVPARCGCRQGLYARVAGLACCLQQAGCVAHAA